MNFDKHNLLLVKSVLKEFIVCQVRILYSKYRTKTSRIAVLTLIACLSKTSCKKLLAVTQNYTIHIKKLLRLIGYIMLYKRNT